MFNDKCWIYVENFEFEREKNICWSPIKDGSEEKPDACWNEQNDE